MEQDTREREIKALLMIILTQLQYNTPAEVEVAVGVAVAVEEERREEKQDRRESLTSSAAQSHAKETLFGNKSHCKLVKKVCSRYNSARPLVVVCFNSYFRLICGARINVGLGNDEELYLA